MLPFCSFAAETAQCGDPLQLWWAVTEPQVMTNPVLITSFTGHIPRQICPNVYVRSHQQILPAVLSWRSGGPVVTVYRKEKLAHQLRSSDDGTGGGDCKEHRQQNPNSTKDAIGCKGVLAEFFYHPRLSSFRISTRNNVYISFLAYWAALVTKAELLEDR